MNFFLDTEFLEQGHEHPLRLISIALVAADGWEYYAETGAVWPSDMSAWLREHVVPKLVGAAAQKSREQIREEIEAFVGYDSSPVFHGYFADYDWVLFCQLWGSMIDLPRHFPQSCMDVRQTALSKGRTRKDLPPDPKDAHNALADARWVRDAYARLGF